jgi:glucose/arabinose dehydrogenase
VDQIGKVWIIFPDGTKSESPFINISDKLVPLTPEYDERGLLGLAFHPDFKNNGKFYLYYTAPPRKGGPLPGVPWDNTSTVAEFKVSQSDPNKADKSYERVLLRQNHPQSNHNGGTIAFGPDDGYLYISIGDGGAADDTGAGHVSDWYAKNAGGNGQDVQQNLLGNILRIDVNSTSENKEYGIPGDNPFVGGKGKDEIYAFGFRNPYRFSFDMGGQHWLYAGDAGQSLYEEIDVVQKGGNYGWNVKEGTHCFNTDNDLRERKACPVEDSAGNPLLDPVIEVTNTANPDGGGLMIAIVGGNVYRGSKLPGIAGRYVFGGLSASGEKAQGKIYVAKSSTIGLWSFEQLKLQSFPGDINQWLKGFGQDSEGEIYVTGTRQLGPQGVTGKVWKLVPGK